MAKYPGRTANNAAKRRLTEEFPHRYRQLQREEYARLNIELPKTDREKAQEKLTAVLEQYPDLAAEVTSAVETADSGPAYEAEKRSPAPEGPPVGDDAELPEGHNFFGTNQ